MSELGSGFLSSSSGGVGPAPSTLSGVAFVADASKTGSKEGRTFDQG